MPNPAAPGGFNPAGRRYPSPPARLRRRDHRFHLDAREAELPRDRRRLEAGLERREHQPFLSGRHRSRPPARSRFRRLAVRSAPSAGHAEGKLQTRRWSKPGEDGDRFSTEILVVPGHKVQFLDKPNGANGNGAAAAAQPVTEPANGGAPAQADNFDDSSDIPF